MNIWTFGHSTLDAAAAITMLRSSGVKVLVDVRSHPVSKWPQWYKSEIEQWIAPAAIAYVHVPALGGWNVEHLGMVGQFPGVDVAAYCAGKFPKHRIGKDRDKAAADGTAWTNQGLYDYQWFMTLDEFRAAIEALLSVAIPGRRHAIMCAEALWWKCHRSMIADALYAATGHQAIHIQPRATPHPAAGRLMRYDPAVIAKWREWGWKHGSDRSDL
jgi:uncharacterized protein (DUF488 family)